MVRIKRAYESPARSDGYRILVDRIWPRGQSKDRLALDEWAKELAPSHALRQSFGHDPRQWKMFQSSYRQELRANPKAQELLRRLGRLARQKTVTLIYGARDERHNQAVVLKHILEDLGRFA